MNRRQMDFITGVLATLAAIDICFISPLLWLYEKDTLCIIAIIFGFICAWNAASIWEYKPKKRK